MNAYTGIDAGATAATITVRNRRFGRDEEQERWWAGGDPVATAWFNALSATFPRGETLFPAWCRYFLPGFHPWNEDDRHLIGKYDSEYAAATIPAGS